MINAYLHIDGMKLKLLKFNFNFNQDLGTNNKPVSKSKGGLINVTLESTKDVSMLEWVESNSILKDGRIEVFNNDGTQITFKIDFANAYGTIGDYSFKSFSNEPMSYTITINPGIIRFNGDNSNLFMQSWNPNNPFLAAAAPISSTDDNVPQITSLQWVNSDTEEQDISSISYNENASLLAVIENHESGTATITIEKEDGTEFENGQKQLSFTEAIDENGIVELTPMEIKEQWEEFKTSDMDKLVAKVSHGEAAKTSRPLVITPKPKVLVNFRPHNGYKGEYGFDWMRMGDTSKPGDIWYKQILGGYPTGTFLTSDTSYVNFGKEFDQETHPIKPKDIYIVPVLSLLPNKSAKFSLKVEVAASNAKKIEYVYDTTLFRLSKVDVSYKTVGKKTLPDDLEITCIKEFAADEYVEVLADGQFAGKLKILANNKANRYKADVVFVHIKTDLNKSGKPKKGLSVGENTFLKKYLNQALVKPKIISKDLDLTKDTILNSTYKLIDNRIAKINDISGIHVHLEKEFDKIYKGYKKHFKVFFFDEEGGEMLTNKSGLKYYQGYNGAARTLNCKEVVLYNTHNPSTTTHEILHAMGLEHSFDDANKYTFKEEKTDNIMDYSHNAGINRISTWKFQWDTIKPNLTKE